MPKVPITRIVWCTVLVWSALLLLGQSAIAAAAPATTAFAANGSYVVVPGDYLAKIAQRFGTSVSALTEANGIANPNLIYPGQQLVIPVDSPSLPNPSPVASVMGSVPSAVVGVAEVRPAVAPAPVAMAMTARETAMFEGLNAQRNLAGLSSLRFEPALMPVSRARSNDMAQRNYFSHTTPEGTTVQDLLRDAGLHYSPANEVLARSNYSEDQVVGIAVSAFMGSANHRYHILSPAYARAAVGEARSADGMYYFTAILAAE